MTVNTADPKTKARLLDRILSIDFDGDLRHLGPDVRVDRIKPNRVKIHFGQSGVDYFLTIQRPRPDKPAAKPAAKKAAKKPVRAKRPAARTGMEGSAETH